MSNVGDRLSPSFLSFLLYYRETAAALAAKGATVIMACRNLELAEKVAEEIRLVLNKLNRHLLIVDHNAIVYPLPPPPILINY